MLLILTFCALVFSACQSQSEEMTLIDNITNISISESNGYGGVNESYFISISQADADAISDFEEVLKNVKAKKQKVDTVAAKPDYDILVRYENGETHGLHLLLRNDGDESEIMYIGHEENSYIISPEDTNKLKKLLEIK